MQATSGTSPESRLTTPLSSALGIATQYSMSKICEIQKRGATSTVAQWRGTFGEEEKKRRGYYL